MIAIKLKISCDRYVFITSNVFGKTLDIGSNDASGWAHAHRMLGIPFERDNDWLYMFDCDKWLHPNMTRGDAHRMPFRTNAFDTVVMGDILEHVIDPRTVLTESERITSSKIIITLPDEYEWHICSKPFHDSNMTDEQVKDATIRHPSQYAKCIDYVDEKKFHHLPHVRHFDYYSIVSLLFSLRYEYYIHINHLYHPLAPQTPDEPPDMAYWAIVATRKNKDNKVIEVK